MFDRTILVGSVRVDFVADGLSARDTASIVDGLTAALETLRERHGEAGVALTAGAHWLAYRPDPRRRALRKRIILERAGDRYNSSYVGSPASRSELEQLLLTYAGERLAAITPSLRGFSGWAALRPQAEMYSEVARRLAISWSGAARRCASRALDACAVIVAPFDDRAPGAYFEPADFRTVIAGARLPALGDSAYFASRRRCVDGVDSVCARMMDEVALPDPFNPIVRGTVLTRAIELGGRGAVARAAERREAPALEALAHIAGVSQDSLLASWHDQTFDTLKAERGATGFPLLFASLGWGALLLFAATRRRFL